MRGSLRALKKVVAAKRQLMTREKNRCKVVLALAVDHDRQGGAIELSLIV